MTLEEIKKSLHGEEYDFLNSNEHLGKNIILLTLGGSIAYGTDIDTSDVDLRGVALNNSKEIFNLVNDFQNIVDTNTDTVVYSLNKIVKLLTECNPNTIEILGVRPEHIMYSNDYGKKLLENKDNFLSKRAIKSFGGYAVDQFNRMEKCLQVDDAKQIEILKRSLENVIKSFNILHSKNTVDLKLRIVTKEKDADIWNNMKHSEKTEIMGSDLVVSGEFKDYPVTELKGIISEVHKCQSEFGKLNKRNAKKTDKAMAKHMMHLLRLYFMGTELNKYGTVTTYREKEHDLLMEVRNMKYLYDDGKKIRPEFYELLDEVHKEYKYSLENSVLTDEPNYEAINEMLCSIYF